MNNVQVNTERGVTSITAQVQINAPKSQVWDTLKVIGDIEKFHPLVKSSHARTTFQSGLGARRHCALLPMGQMEEEAVEWEEGKKIVMEVIGGKFLPPYEFMQGKIELSGASGVSNVTFTFSYKLKFGILGRMMDVIMIRPQFKKAPPQYVSGLKEYLEARRVEVNVE